MPITVDELTPYLSVIIVKIHDDTFDIHSLRTNLCLGNNIFIEEDHNINGRIYYINYTESKSVFWASGTNLLDRINHILIVYKFHNYLAIYHSDNSKNNKLYRLMLRTPIRHEFKKLRLIRKDVFHIVFINNNKIKNLWLNNIDKASDIKADSKMLSGSNLEQSLDPIGDQTYSFSAIKVQENNSSIGVNSSDSKVWIKKFSDSTEYFDEVRNILEKIRDVDIQTNLQACEFPILATSHMDITQLGNLIDIQIESIENFSSASDEYMILHEVNSIWDDFLFNYSFNIQTNIYHIEVTVAPNDIRSFGFELNIENHQVIVNFIYTDYQSKEITHVLENKNLVKLWFENYQVISHGFIYKQNFKDIFFKGFEWCNFHGFSVKKEKPTNNNFLQIGQPNEDSLFSWIKKYWKGHTNNLVDMNQQHVPGWLICDDGAGEKADFIHVSNEQVPTISLIHIKGSNSDTPQRRIAVTPYEVVVSQSVKNIRYLDREILIESIENANTNVTDLVWNNGNNSTRVNFKQYLENLPVYNKRIVVLQPHVQANKYNNPISDGAKIQKNLLNTLLVSAQSSIQGLGAEFVVIGTQ